MKDLKHLNHLTHLIRLPLAAAALSLSACGGEGSGSDNWARLRDFALTPAVLRAPATGAEVLNVRLDYLAEFQSDTHLPTYWLFGHLLPKGQAPISAETPVNRVVAQPCGQQAYACGEPFTRLCSVSLGWVDPAKRHINCGSGDPALEVPPGPYVFVASACYTDSKGTRVCNSISRDVVLQ